MYINPIHKDSSVTLQNPDTLRFDWGNCAQFLKVPVLIKNQMLCANKTVWLCTACTLRKGREFILKTQTLVTTKYSGFKDGFDELSRNLDFKASGHITNRLGSFQGDESFLKVATQFGRKWVKSCTQTAPYRLAFGQTAPEEKRSSSSVFWGESRQVCPVFHPRKT